MSRFLQPLVVLDGKTIEKCRKGRRRGTLNRLGRRGIVVLLGVNRERRHRLRADEHDFVVTRECHVPVRDQFTDTDGGQVDQCRIVANLRDL